ncbi:hypothetical protein ETAA8_29430 [Anatilimnocola aggregata]|uniref:Uncharacterized protein n=1 Tax=Anatilimnocola aggregata TaxID=2528021 RepID=A0A517YCK1_9BACT|nr:hypothetical protein [Anatilimnocola aggregata]QDU27852.1 hypothetical protein ETAA8_29430 [Anatilimnocola aggregata]
MSPLLSGDVLRSPSLPVLKVNHVPKTNSPEVELSRRSSDRRATKEERRKESVPVAAERRGTDRRKVQRRRQIDPTTCERDYSGEEIEFMQAMDAYKRANGRMFPTCSEILEVIRGMGYVRLNGTPNPTEGTGSDDVVASSSDENQSA